MVSFLIAEQRKLCSVVLQFSSELLKAQSKELFTSQISSFSNDSFCLFMIHLNIEIFRNAFYTKLSSYFSSIIKNMSQEHVKNQKKDFYWRGLIKYFK